MIKDWFQHISVEQCIDNSCEWNFEICVNGVLLHSRNSLWHGYFCEEKEQQCLVWRAISDLLSKGGALAVKGA